MAIAPPQGRRLANPPTAEPPALDPPSLMLLRGSGATYGLEDGALASGYRMFVPELRRRIEEREPDEIVCNERLRRFDSESESKPVGLVRGHIDVSPQNCHEKGRYSLSRLR
jgi:hypothetical protein